MKIGIFFAGFLMGLATVVIITKFALFMNKWNTETKLTNLIIYCLTMSNFFLFMENHWIITERHQDQKSKVRKKQTEKLIKKKRFTRK
jgi:hypothetical protein